MDFSTFLRRVCVMLLPVMALACGAGPDGSVAGTDEQGLSNLRLQAEDFDSGGEGVGYHDTTRGNTGGAYRTGDVDIEPTSDPAGGYDVGWVAAGEWLRFSFKAPLATTYSFRLRLASHVVGTKRVHLEVDGRALPAVTTTDATGWQSWFNLAGGSVPLSAGAHQLRVVFDTGGVNLDYVDLLYTPPPPPPAALVCPPGFPAEAFRDDFNGSALDTSKWDVVTGKASGSGDGFTALTNMVASTISVSNGTLKIASNRYCENPSTQPGAAVHPGKCSGTNYYGGGWIKTRGSFASGRGTLLFLAKVPSPVEGFWPGLWGRNTSAWATSGYGEMDLYENWWDLKSRGQASDPNAWAATTWLTTEHSNNNNVGPFPNVAGAFHVYSVRWDATVTPATITYEYQAQPGAAPVHLRTVTYASAGYSGLSDSGMRNILNQGWRAYVDFAVQPSSTWHIGPDAASTYAPAPLEVDSVIICHP